MIINTEQFKKLIADISADPSARYYTTTEDGHLCVVIGGKKVLVNFFFALVEGKLFGMGGGKHLGTPLENRFLCAHVGNKMVFSSKNDQFQYTAPKAPCEPGSSFLFITSIGQYCELAFADDSKYGTPIVLYDYVSRAWGGYFTLFRALLGKMSPASVPEFDDFMTFFVGKDDKND